MSRSESRPNAAAAARTLAGGGSARPTARYSVGRLTAVSFKPYRGHQLELRDSGRNRCTVIIHPPGGRGAPHQLNPEGGTATLAELIAQAKAMIDAVLGPRPPMPARGFRPRM